MALFSVWTVVTVLFMAYIGNSIYSLYLVYHVENCSGTNCLSPYTSTHNQQLQLRLISSTSPSVRKTGTEIHRIDDFDPTKEFESDIDVELPSITRRNGSLWIHIFLLPMTDAQSPLNAEWFVHQTAKMTEFQVPQAATFNLMGGAENKTSPEKEKVVSTEQPKKLVKPVTHWRSILPFGVATDDIRLNPRGIPGEIYHLIKFTDTGEYYPVLYLDELSFRVRDLVEVKETSTSVKLKISYNPISLGKMRLLHVAQHSIQQLKTWGFTEKDVDEVKSIFTDTNFYFLALTFFVAAVHLLLDFLAIKNDVRFWKNRRTLTGLSARTVLWNCCSHFIIFVYLWDQDTSLLVLLPAGVGVIIEAWKVVKTYTMRKRLEGNIASAEEKDTESFDSQGMKYLMLVMVPLCFGGAVYSLLYIPHRSWFSWVVQCMANGVYAFGFLFMLPQLFINYKLKSVAHLPWRAFMYKAFNTFIDDMFAFIIKMPTAHRLACFRDDVVFVIYLYQRWLYPVDRKRVNEFGESFEDVQELETKKTK